jgi:plasmid stabilization system protein ParE
VPRELSYTDKALADLDAAKGWLTQPGSGPAARRRLAAIWAAIEGLRDHPCLCPIGQHQGVRELLCAGGYRALYRVNPDTGRDETAGDVQVLRVFGPGQNRGTI